MKLTTAHLFYRPETKFSQVRPPEEAQDDIHHMVELLRPDN
jgi:hypothetical protein